MKNICKANDPLTILDEVSAAEATKGFLRSFALQDVSEIRKLYESTEETEPSAQSDNAG